MMEATLHATPRWRDVVLEQIRIVGLSLHTVALVAAVVLVAGTVVVWSEIATGGPGFDSHDIFPTAVVSFLFPFAVWKSDKRFGPAFLWTLPVDRTRMALAKVFAGGVWLLAALAFFAAWLLALALIAHVSPAQMLMRIPVFATIAAYLFGSALVLGLRHPLRWLLGTVALIILLAYVFDPDNVPLLASSGLFPALERAAARWRTLPDLAQWAIPTFLWLGAGLAALWAAASRHRERRRR